MKLIEFKIETQVEKKYIYREATVHRAASFCSLLSGPLVTVECDTQEKKKTKKHNGKLVYWQWERSALCAFSGITDVEKKQHVRDHFRVNTSEYVLYVRVPENAATSCDRRSRRCCRYHA